MMSIPHELCTIVTTVQELIEKIYPDVAHMEWFCERAIGTDPKKLPNSSYY